MSSSRIVRLRSEGILGGVCAGLGAYLRLDASLIRLFFILLAFAEGIGVMAYFVLWLVLPGDSGQEAQALEETVRESVGEMADRARNLRSDLSRGFDGAHPQLPLIIGGALIILGIAFLVDSLNLVWLSWARFELLWPGLLILGGIVLLVRRVGGD